MATSVRIPVGLESFQFELDSAIRTGSGELLGIADALRLIQRRLGISELRRLSGLVARAALRHIDWDHDDQQDTLRRTITQLISSGRLRVRKIEAVSYRVLGTTVRPEEEEERVENEIAETHQVTIELLDKQGNPVPGEPYRIALPDGRVVTGNLDNQGRAQITGIPQAGTCKVCFYKRDASIWAPA